MAISEAAGNIIPLRNPSAPSQRKKPQSATRERFKLIEYLNPRTGTMSHRISGVKRDGVRIRENFADLKSAQCRKVELETEWLARQTETAIRATKLTATQLHVAEAAFMRLEADEELLLAVEHWLRHGKAASVVKTARLDEAFKSFREWLDSKDCKLRLLSKTNLVRRVNIFVNSSPNISIADISSDAMQAFLDARDISPKSKDNDRRAISRFFSWCMEKPRRWTAANPCQGIEITQDAETAPVILTVQECRRLLRAASLYKKGKLAPYAAVCVFAGLRPFETSRLDWSKVNLADKEIRLEGVQTKTGDPRVVAIHPTLAAWLEAYKGRPFFAANWRRDFDAIKAAVGYGTPTKKRPDLKPWPVDVLRHTAISFYFRDTGSYGRTAEQFGNSEAIIKKHYQGRVSTEETAKFYAIKPVKKG